MGVTRSFRLAAGVLTGALVLGAAATTAAEAKPPTKPGGITNLTASVTGHPGDRYDVAATWDPVANATSYKAQLTKAGAVLTSVTVTSPAWSPTVSTNPGAASLTVRAVVGRRTGKPSSVPVQLPDVTAPTGAFSASSNNTTGQATITQDALGDDSGAANVTRVVDWGDGSPHETWTTGTTINHTYTLTPAQEIRFPATVTIKDAANNSVTVDVAPAPVFNDHNAPTGAFTAAPSSAWAKLTKVTVTQGSLSDDRTPAADITRTVDWKDGSAPEAWTSGTTLSHTYTKGGTFTPVVSATDEAGNVAALASTAVTVKVDKTAPVVKLTIPRNKHSVRAWRTLRGKATDTNGTGVKKVNLKAVEKRGRVWYGYNRQTKKWVKGGTEAKAFARARAFSLKTTSTHTWAAKLVNLTKGTLVYRVTATDRVANTSAPVTHLTRLTRH